MPSPTSTSAPTDSAFDTVSLHAPGPNCKWAGFIGPAPEFEATTEQVDYMAFQQIVTIEEDGAETIEAERLVPIVVDFDGKTRVLVQGVDGFQCLEGDAEACLLRLRVLGAAARAATAAATSVLLPSDAPAATPSEGTPDAT